ncbi:MAG TPA: hypothetical protein VIO11_11175 [Candidatus Methanoperedens sp.]
MLETSKERNELLKAGISGKTIEKLYLLRNNFKIVRFPVLFQPVEIETLEEQDRILKCEASAEYCCI